MALTHHLKSKLSPVRPFLANIAPQLALAGSRGNIGREAARELRFNSLTAHQLAVSIPREVEDKRSHGAPVGTAFDYRARMMLGGFALEETVAVAGLEYFSRSTTGISRGKHMARMLTEGLALADAEGNISDPEALDRLAVVLAWCESFYRAGVPTVVRGSLGRQLRKAKSAEMLLESIDPMMLKDLAALRAGSIDQIDAWIQAITSGLRFEPNPVFTGSGLVGGADGDWILGDTLIDCKSTETLTNPWIRDTLFQLLGYALLDLDDSLAIRQIGIWLPRRQALQTWSLDEVLGEPADTALPRLRSDFESTIQAWNEERLAASRARREAMAKWREEFVAEMRRREEAELAREEERKAKRREADRKRREAKKAQGQSA
ncbi:hypothetical protein ACWIDW_04865 [Microbacterium sp. NPDC055312]